MSNSDFGSMRSKVPRRLSLYSLSGLVVVASLLAFLLLALINQSYFENWRRAVVVVGAGICFVLLLIPEIPLGYILGGQLLSIWSYSAYDRVEFSGIDSPSDQA